MDCIFCQIIEGKIPSTKIYEDKDLVVINDIHPVAPVHVLIIPKEHFPSLVEAKDKHSVLLGKLLLTARDTAKSLGVSTSGYKIVINNKEDAGQIVFHLHIHLIGGWQKKAEGYRI
mgnify:CR=1 FL=1